MAQSDEPEQPGCLYWFGRGFVVGFVVSFVYHAIRYPLATCGCMAIALGIPTLVAIVLIIAWWPWSVVVPGIVIVTLYFGWVGLKAYAENWVANHPEPEPESVVDDD